VISLSVSESRKEKLTGALDFCSSDTARRLAGKLQFTLSWTFGRVGRAALQPLYARSHEPVRHKHRTDLALLRALLFLTNVVRLMPPVEYEIDKPFRPTILVWSDAMWEPSAPVPAQGGFVILIPGEHGEQDRAIFSSHVTPMDVLRAFVRGKQQYIGQLEILYAQCVYTSCPRTFRDRNVIHFVDNTSAVAGLVKGYAAPIDSARIVNAFHAYNVGIRARVYFELARPARPRALDTFEFNGHAKKLRGLSWRRCRYTCVRAAGAPAEQWVNGADTVRARVNGARRGAGCAGRDSRARRHAEGGAQAHTHQRQPC
jgi:hypothetical protein